MDKLKNELVMKTLKWHSNAPEKLVHSKSDACLKENLVATFPTRNDIGDAFNAMLQLTQCDGKVENYKDRIDACHKILKLMPAYEAEIKRCQECQERLNEYLPKLESTSEDDYATKIQLLESIIELCNDECYPILLNENKEKLKSQKQYLQSELLKEYVSEKAAIMDKANRIINHKQYHDVAELVDRYRSVADNDYDFFGVIEKTIDLAKKYETNTVTDKLATCLPDDYQTKKDLYTKLIQYEPFNQEYLSQLYQCEEALNLHDSDNQDEFFHALSENAHKKVNDDPIVVEAVPAAAKFSQKSLCEIKDKDLIARIASFIDSSAKFCQNSSVATKKASEFLHKYSSCGAIQLIPYMHEVSGTMEILSKGGSLVSKALGKASGVFTKTSEALAAYQNDNTTKSGIDNALAVVIIKSAKLMSRDSNDNNSANIESYSKNFSDIVSLIVSNKSMHQIGAELNQIQSALSEISNFQKSEYKGKVEALCAQVTRRSDFRTEIMMNEELRLRELSSLSQLEHECVELIGQANNMIIGYTSNNLDNYAKYEADIPNIAVWVGLQNTLLFILDKISKLSFIFNRGNVSEEYYYKMYRIYEKKSFEALSQLRKYHSDAANMFGIDLEKSRRKSDSIGGKFLSMFSNENYDAISEETVKLIGEQMLKPSAKMIKNTNPFQNDVQIVMKHDKLYYYSEEEADTRFNIDWAIDVLKKAE